MKRGPCISHKTKITSYLKRNDAVHQSKKGSSFFYTSAESVSESGYSEKLEVSPALLKLTKLFNRISDRMFVLTLSRVYREQDFFFVKVYTSLSS
jgi:hypothetical protein